MLPEVPTTNAEGKDLKHHDQNAKHKGDYISVIRDNKGEVSSSAAYDNTGKIVSQIAKIITSTTGGPELQQARVIRKFFSETALRNTKL